MKKRPNILFLMSDEHRPDVTGYEGNTVIRTPVLDELARTGVVFRNAYTPSPICIPGRQCMMSGQLPRTCGCEHFGQDLSPGSMTFARRFSQYAYNTVCAGKLHHTGSDQMQGWTERIVPDAHITPKYIEGAIKDEFDRYPTPPGVGKWGNQREVEEARGESGPCQTRDQQVTDASLDYLDRYFHDPMYQRPRAHQPLLFKLSLIQPLYPFFTDPERFQYYHDRAPVFLEDPCNHPVLSLSQNNKPVDVTEAQIRNATAAYYGMIDQIDVHYGSVLDRLRSLGEDLDEWIIVYTSDHGEMLGEHGIWEKTRFYEASARVPLIIRWPKGFEGGRVIDANVNLCDLFATLCDLAGLETPDGLDSRSLVPLLQGDKSGWDNETISQVRGAHLMIKKDALKYQYYGEDIPEVLFDLEADPKELENHAEDPNYSEAMTAFRIRRGELGFGPEADPDYRNAGYQKQKE